MWLGSSGRLRRCDVLDKERRAATGKARRVARKAAGLCRDCDEPARPNHVLCSRCTEAQAARDKERYASRKAAGLCAAASCKTPAMIGAAYCLVHAVKQGDQTRRSARRAAYLRARAAKAKANGICGICHKSPARPGRATCQRCADQKVEAQRRRHALRREQGLCARRRKHHMPAADKDTPF